jgi:hypothetical protein
VPTSRMVRTITLRPARESQHRQRFTPPEGTCRIRVQARSVNPKRRATGGLSA